MSSFSAGDAPAASSRAPPPEPISSRVQCARFASSTDPEIAIGSVMSAPSIGLPDLDDRGFSVDGDQTAVLGSPAELIDDAVRTDGVHPVVGRRARPQVLDGAGGREAPSKTRTKSPVPARPPRRSTRSSSVGAPRRWCPRRTRACRLGSRMAPAPGAVICTNGAVLSTDEIVFDGGCVHGEIGRGDGDSILAVGEFVQGELVGGRPVARPRCKLAGRTVWMVENDVGNGRRAGRR